MPPAPAIRWYGSQGIIDEWWPAALETWQAALAARAEAASASVGRAGPCQLARPADPDDCCTLGDRCTVGDTTATHGLIQRPGDSKIAFGARIGLESVVSSRS